jgi:hypothetical protein
MVGRRPMGTTTTVWLSSRGADSKEFRAHLTGHRNVPVLGLAFAAPAAYDYPA